MDKELLEIKLWRTEPIKNGLRSEAQHFPEEYVFPSGRQALSQALFCTGLGRSSRVAFPEWSSHCVISAIGRFCTPIPMTEVIKNNLDVDAVIVYEQWGWPIIESAMEQLKNRFENKVFILDMVDSAHFRPDQNINRGSFNTNAFIQITSLSKLLGLSTGGLTCVDGKYLSFQAETAHNKVVYLFENSGLYNEGFVNNILKSAIVAVDSYLKDWLNKNDLLAAIESERLLRQNNLRKVIINSLSNDWPNWMRRVIKNGAGPGIVPFYKGKADNQLKDIQKNLVDRFGIETAVYRFNWSGNPLEPEYDKCLAFPMHGMVENIAEILEWLKIK